MIPNLRSFRTYSDLPGSGTAEVLEQVLDQRQRLADRLASIRHVVAVASGKGGVGKSAITANVAAALARGDQRVGALDGDLNGPSLPRMLAAPHKPLHVIEDGVLPATGVAGVRLVSLDLLLATADAPLRWRGPHGDASLWRGAIETGAMRELLADVVWGELDYLLVDLPPGTDRIERFLELVPNPAAVILVTTPAAAAIHVVTRSARLLAEAGVAPVGLVINMSGYVCPGCGTAAPLFTSASSAEVDEVLGSRDGLAVWGEIPFDPRFAGETDQGRPFVLDAPDAPAARALMQVVDRLREACPT